MENAIKIENLSITYKNNTFMHKALDNLCLNIPANRIFGFLGPNGAGKTTTIKALLNLIPVQTGKISILGMENSCYTARKNLGYMPEIANYYWYLTPRELLLMYAGIFRIKKKQAADKISSLIEMVGLSGYADVLMKNFSKGMMQKISFAQALINDPEILILDEPTSGLDPIARMNMRDIIKKLKDQGKTIFFSSHELSEIELICDNIAILNKGRLIITESVQQIMEKSQGYSLEKYFFRLIKGNDEDNPDNSR